ncbi:MAG: hypothetical protein PHU25_17230 [Deltaproteobacteria bacterium]|nr:hypothetical protein [Deltaproteobacteria bacterium]
MDQIIGSITVYIGDEYPGLHGCRVRIRAILRGSLRPDVNVDADDHFVSDDATLAQLGGVTADDRVDVQPWIEEAGRFSFVSQDPRAIDLAIFKELARAR